jgi:hypothetical protein
VAMSFKGLDGVASLLDTVCGGLVLRVRAS